MTHLQDLPDLLLEPVVRAALLEDLGRNGDITTDAVVPADAQTTAEVNARKAGTIAGVRAATLAFRLIDPRVEAHVLAADGAEVAPGQPVLRISGPARSILTTERIALNFLCRMSGIATATAEIVRAIRPHHARVTCTRKTTPGLRALEKHAVRAGGGANHRFGLDDAVLIKDNHIALAGGVAEAIERARARVGHLVKIEVEVDTLKQLETAIDAAPDAVLLDNMAPSTLRRAVELVDGRMVTEASGRITAKTAPAIAETGVDLISAGWLTHSAPSLDLGLDIAA